MTISFPNARQPRPPAGPGITTGWTLHIVALLLATSATLSTASAQQRYAFEHLTVKQGLSQGTVNCILQDSDGFMWFGTQDGLNKYDGYRIRVFKHSPADSGSLNDNWIISIAEDSNRTLWIQTMNQPDVLNRYDRLTESFVRVPRDSVNLTGAHRSIVAWDFVEPGGVQWHGTNGGGVTRFDPRTGTTTVYRHDPTDPRSLIDDRVMYIYGDRRGEIWVGTKGGLDRLDVGKGTFTHYRHDPTDPGSLSNNWVWPIFEDRQGTLWVGTYGGGLNRFDRATATFVRYRHVAADQRSLNGDNLLSIYQDRSGMIWVGMDQQGVDRFHPEMQAFSRYAHEPSDPAGLSENNVYCMCVDRTGSLWVGTQSGVDVLDRSTGEFRHFRFDPSKPRGIGADLAQCFVEDRKGDLWIGFRSNGLDRFQRSTGTFTHYRHDPSDAKSLSDNNVYALYEDRSGAIWVGTHKGGLNRFDPATGTFTRYLHVDSHPGSLGAVGAWAICEDRQGTLWVGTFGGGLDRLDRASGTFTHFRHNETDSTSLSDNIVTYLCEDRSGTLWVGTASGLNKLNRESGTFTRYTEGDGLPNNAIFGILEDSAGSLWISTNKGLSRFDPRSGAFRNFDSRDGLQGDEFNMNACAIDARTSEMFFGGSNGFNAFFPHDVKDNTYVPPVVFSAFARYNTDDEEGKPIEERGIDAKTEIVLSYKDNVANFEFAALSYYNNYMNRYAYQLEGYSDNWIQLGTERKATFTNLDGGEYTLRVRGSNNDGTWNEQGASLRIVVMPPWWRTTWAYGAYGLLAVGFLYSVRRFEINRREQKARVRESELRAKAVEAEKRALEAENERKTKELEDARRLQLSMLPKEVPSVPGYEIAVFMKTATEVGGDYYDFQTGEDGTLHVALGDATGHGMQAGTMVTLMKGLFLSDVSRFDIQTFLRHCSHAIKEIRLGRLFMAFTLVRLRGSSVCLSTAGMPPVYLRRKNAPLEEILLKGMPLGAMKNFPYTVHQTDLNPGDTLLLLTDGLPEQKNPRGEMFDYARIQSAITAGQGLGPDELVNALVQEGEQWMGGSLQEDDITILAIRRTDPDGATKGDV
jgi:ligand-binding sensor domain-containing protein/serine phosphatase RsbU (regulator of sigma subunit)